jgi:hypothetical protein
LGNLAIAASNAGVVPAGVERSCRIDPEDMNAATLKLTALSEMVKRLMKKNEKFHPDFPWSSKARDLPHKLNTVGLDELMLVSWPNLRMKNHAEQPGRLFRLFERRGRPNAYGEHRMQDLALRC